MDEVAELQEELPEGDSEETTGEVVEEEESATSEEVVEEKPKAKGVQKRIDELTGNWRSAERRADQLQEALIEAQRQRQAPKEPVAPPPQQNEPKVDDYGSYEEYLSALADHRAEAKVTAKFAELQRSHAEEMQKRQKAERDQAFQAKVQTFRESHEDFDDVVRNPSLPITDDMVGLLNLSEKGPELLYQLGKNPAEAARIAGLPRDQAAMEMGRMEAKLGQIQPKTNSNAPPPIEPLTEGRGSLSKDPDKMTTSEWKRWREGNLRNSNG